jgi:hypothetical protein
MCVFQLVGYCTVSNTMNPAVMVLQGTVIVFLLLTVCFILALEVCQPSLLHFFPLHLWIHQTSLNTISPSF